MHPILPRGSGNKLRVLGASAEFSWWGVLTSRYPFSIISVSINYLKHLVGEAGSGGSKQIIFSGWRWTRSLSVYLCVDWLQQLHFEFDTTLKSPTVSPPPQNALMCASCLRSVWIDPFPVRVLVRLQDGIVHIPQRGGEGVSGPPPLINFGFGSGWVLTPESWTAAWKLVWVGSGPLLFQLAIFSEELSP